MGAWSLNHWTTREVPVIAFLISFLDCSLHIYRNTTGFCVLIFYPANLLNSLIRALVAFLWITWDFLYIGPCYLQIEIILLFFFHSNLDVFFSFSCLFALARTSSKILNSSDESGRSYLVPDLMEKVFNLLPLSEMLAMFFFFFK